MTKLHSIEGASKGTVNLPAVFKTPYRPDVIQRAVIAQQSSRRTPYAQYELAGRHTSAEYYGQRKEGARITMNKSMSRLPRIKPGGGGLGQVRGVSQAKAGPKLHAPKGTDYTKKINNKEAQLALKSAIAATSNIDLILQRGHKVSEVPEVPLVVEDAFESLSKAKDILAAFKKLGLTAEIERTKTKTTGSSHGVSRGRVKRTKKSVLIVVGPKSKVLNAATNIPGVDAVEATSLTVEDVAPGGKAGRLTVWTQSALKHLPTQHGTQ
ncbi:50S ribosomal protein L4 [uncultured archaeon]|nr:50S ribosomal protein L4 [uncultured archaeon]